jgi:2,3-bisphosphoglycerate-dependent phosphoglycerate mutase
MNQLVIIRHGLTEWTTRFTGWTDIDLAPEGVELTKKYALRLKENDFSFDIGFASRLKRGVRTLETALTVLNQELIPVIKDWRLNERHYGALQGLSKAETAEKYGEDQVKIWRRSFAVPPPSVEKTDPRHPVNDPMYKDVDPALLPAGESLKDTYERVIPYFREKVEPELIAGKKVILSGHSNSIRAIVKYLEGLTEEEIVDVNIPYCIPLIYDLDDNLKLIKRRYLASDSEVAESIQSIKNQAKKTPSENT